ncbi:MAG: aminotransferase class I/II-fold pyridoxal phosphate-dependent enzyme [Spirochaetaceae bacterium]|jgi:aspartate/methionine/tyrosine aminotransferase|nr:aminotransferase class I/II-fold pyridoxal phosphate-dependent enzyme [Spirochaetaceae bacterium]
MKALADELNQVLDSTIAGRLLSPLGRRLYFPKGIIAQAGEAKKAATTANATIGMAYAGGKPLALSSVAGGFSGLLPEEAVVYAPTAGIEAARAAWKDLLGAKNPSLDLERVSLPVVVPGLTGGISFMADLFLAEGDTLMAGGPCWDNYAFIAETRRGASFKEIPLFDDRENPGGLALDSISSALKGAGNTVKLILNFPNNPSGYSPTRGEAERLLASVKDAADAGADVLVLCDDAYFGFFYEKDCASQSLFAGLALLHERVLAVKIDGPTKEDYSWGLRTGFITFGSKGLTNEHYEALVKKLMGAIRSSVSCANTPAQHLMLKTLADSRSASEKARFFSLLERRYRTVKQCVAEHEPHPNLRSLPFNAGYFMTFQCRGVHAETLRKTLLEQEGIGTVSFGGSYLRVAFSSVDEALIPVVYRSIYRAARELAGKT